jgi:hypothetical protein
LQLTPQSAAFAGVRAQGKVLSGSLELSGSAEPRSAATAGYHGDGFGRAVSAPGTFDVILPVRVGYDLLKEKITQAIAAVGAVRGPFGPGRRNLSVVG